MSGGGRQSTKSVSSKRHESRLMSLIDQADTIKRYERDVKRMWAGALDPVGFLKAASVDAAVQVADLMRHGETDRIRLDACKDVLDRAGYGPATKVAVSGQMRVDHDTSKVELVNMIMSLAKQTGMRVKDDTPELPPMPTPEVIDAEAVPVAFEDAGPHASAEDDEL